VAGLRGKEREARRDERQRGGSNQFPQLKGKEKIWTDLKNVESSSHISLGELEESGETGRVKFDSGEPRKKEKRR